VLGELLWDGLHDAPQRCTQVLLVRARANLLKPVVLVQAVGDVGQHNPCDPLAIGPQPARPEPGQIAGVELCLELISQRKYGLSLLSLYGPGSLHDCAAMAATRAP
jgi:hypothetical protein